LASGGFPVVLALEVSTSWWPANGSVGSPNSAHIRGTLVPVEEPSTASINVSSIDAGRVHDLRIMVAHGFRNLEKRQL